MFIFFSSLLKPGSSEIIAYYAIAASSRFFPDDASARQSPLNFTNIISMQNIMLILLYYASFSFQHWFLILEILSIILIRFVEKINFYGAYQGDSHFHKVIKSRPIITANQKCHDCQTIALNNRGTFSFYMFGTLSHLIRTAFCIFIIISELKKVVKR